MASLSSAFTPLKHVKQIMPSVLWRLCRRCLLRLARTSRSWPLVSLMGLDSVSSRRHNCVVEAVVTGACRVRSGPQSRCPALRSHPQSAPPSRARSRLYLRRSLFRPTRPAPGQVRDAAPRATRRSARHHHRDCLWLLAPFLLRRPGRLASRRSARSPTRATRTTVRAQADRRGCRIPAGVPRPASACALGRTVSAPQRALWAAGASAQRRPCPGPPQKKSLTGPVPPTRPVHPQLVNPAYEAMRTWALTKPRPRRCPAGVALVLGRGLAAWVLLAPTWPLPTHSQPAPIAVAPPSLSGNSDHVRAIVSVLATLVEHAQQEVAR